MPATAGGGKRGMATCQGPLMSHSVPKWRQVRFAAASVKLFDVRRLLCPFQQTDQAVETTVANHGDDIERIRDTRSRIARDDDQVRQCPGGNAAEVAVEPQGRRGVRTRCL